MGSSSYKKDRRKQRDGSGDALEMEKGTFSYFSQLNCT